MRLAIARRAPKRRDWHRKERRAAKNESLVPMVVRWIPERNGHPQATKALPEHGAKGKFFWPATRYYTQSARFGAMRERDGNRILDGDWPPRHDTGGSGGLQAIRDSASVVNE
jgi:hypothetical protein